MNFKQPCPNNSSNFKAKLYVVQVDRPQKRGESFKKDLCYTMIINYPHIKFKPQDPMGATLHQGTFGVKINYREVLSS